MLNKRSPLHDELVTCPESKETNDGDIGSLPFVSRDYKWPFNTLERIHGVNKFVCFASGEYNDDNSRLQDLSNI